MVTDRQAREEALIERRPYSGLGMFDGSSVICQCDSPYWGLINQAQDEYAAEVRARYW